MTSQALASIDFRHLSSNWLPLLLFFLLEAATAGIVLIIAWFLPPRRMQSTAGPRPRRYQYLWWSPWVGVTCVGIAVEQFSEGSWVMAGDLFFIAIFLTLALIFLERRYRNQEDIAITLRRRGPVLLLRSFNRDMIISNEAALAGEVERQIGNFVALGNPREIIPPGSLLPLGSVAKRLYLADGAWRTQLTELAGRARALLMWPDVTPAVRWELGMIRDSQLHRRLFVVIPPGRRRRAAIDLSPVYRFLSGLPTSSWSEFAEVLQEYGFHSPEVEPRPGTVLTFEPDGRCIIVARGPLPMRQLVSQIAEQIDKLPEITPLPDTPRKPQPAGQRGSES